MIVKVPLDRFVTQLHITSGKREDHMQAVALYQETRENIEVSEVRKDSKSTQNSLQ